MKNSIEKLVKMGLTENEAIEFIKNISMNAYENGYHDCVNHISDLFGVKLDEDGMNFKEWFDVEIKYNHYIHK
jgi:hypothetical protein